MKKLLALLLLSPLVAGEEVEYPVELSCETGTGIFLVKLDEGLSYAQPISSEFTPKRKHNTKLDIKIKIVDDFIHIRDKKTNGVHLYLIINRLNLSAIEYAFKAEVFLSGKCTKGFKEYNKKQI